MEDLKMLAPSFPPGFRFHPTDEELINDYLKNKVSCIESPNVSIMADIDLYKFNPWELPDKALFGENEWFFFSPRDRLYPNGSRPNRTASSGYWKATGIDKPILSREGSICIGVKKSLVFYTGRPPKSIKSDWIMYEYRLLDKDNGYSTGIIGSKKLDDWVLCRIRQRTNIPCLKKVPNVSNKSSQLIEDEKDIGQNMNYNFEDFDLVQQDGDEQMKFHFLQGSSKNDIVFNTNSDSRPFTINKVALSDFTRVKYDF